MTSSIRLIGLLAAAAIVLGSACGDDDSSDPGSTPEGSATPPAASSSPTSGHDTGNSQVSSPGTNPGTASDPAPTEPASTSIRIRLTNGNAAQPITIVTTTPQNQQGWWRIIEPGPAPFTELRIFPFAGVCPCDDPECDRSLPPEVDQETLTLQPGEEAIDTWDGTYYVRDNQAMPPCQVRRTADAGPWRVEFTYSPGVEGEDGQISQPSRLRSDEFAFGEDDEAVLVTP
ncbi:MAG: hypothetical protein EA398_17580 [Deltaproteobacteria bacterium]|nr:MAG: hypothetical protein EA398_17580 [Deltaproteobacteria bacterium]